MVQTFLPALADAKSTREIVKAVIEATGATSPKEMGRVMGAIMKEHKGKVDGGLAKQIAAEILAD